MSLTTTRVAQISTDDELKKVQRDLILTYNRSDGKKMIYGGTMEKIVESLLTWLTTEPNRKGVFNVCLCVF